MVAFVKFDIFLKNSSLISIILLLWVMSHQYGGIFHDAQLYAVQALSHNMENFKNDLFLQNDSQDNYSIFSIIYSFFIRIIGLDNATLCLSILGQLFWLSAFYYVIAKLLTKEAQWLALISICILPHYYCKTAFQYAESFLTARIYAEAFVLFGIAMMLRNKNVSSLLCFFIGILFHPLMAWFSIPLLYYYQFYTRQRTFLLLLCLSILSLVFIKLMSIDLLERLFTSMDNEWLTINKNRSPFIFVDTWKINDYYKFIVTICIFTIALIEKNKYCKLYLSIFCISIFGLLLSYIGGSYYKSILIIQVQPWRVLWIVQVFYIVYFSGFIVDYWKKNKTTKTIILLTLSGLLLSDYKSVFIALFAPFLWWFHNKYPEKEIHYLLWIGAYGLMVESSLLWVKNYYYTYETNVAWTVNYFDNYIFIFFILVSFLLIFYYSYLKTTSSKNALFIAASFNIVCFLIIGSLYSIDKNQANYFYDTFQTSDIEKLKKIIPINAVIYWGDGNERLTWFILNRSNYVSTYQTAGLIFSRATAIEAKRRAQLISQLGMKDGVYSLYTWHSDKAAQLEKLLPSVSNAGLVKVCKDSILDFVILPTKIRKDALSFSIYQASEGKNKTHFYYLYHCKKLNHEA